MTDQWDDIKAAVEQIEKERIINELSLPGGSDDLKSEFPPEKSFAYVNFLCEICYGVGVAIFTMIVNYFVFVWFLHLNLTF